ncbi:MAG: VTC domain-containing protein [Eggerthellaceae bacterium]|nr:VTC domain-containing protein [Eggerthellaceae bacterium]
MASYAEVFERIEKKYRIDEEQRRTMEESSYDSGLAPDAYGRSAITSVYLDTPEFSLIGRSLEKPLYKEKIRIRAYGKSGGETLVNALQTTDVWKDPESIDVLGEDAFLPVFLELKKKFKGVVYKRRVMITLGATILFVTGHAEYLDACARFPLANPASDASSKTPLSCQIASELKAFFQRHPGLYPSFAIACERVAWAAVKPEDGSEPAAAPRITYDDNLLALNMRTAPKDPKGFVWKDLMAQGESLM